MSDKKKWYAVYTRHRWEKKVNQLLIERGFETYCPLNKIQRKWSDRLKIVEEPLFKSYVFVRITDAEKASIRMTNGVVNFVYWLGKPAIVKDREITRIRKFLDEYPTVEVENVELKPNDKVQLTSGVFMNKKATVIKAAKKRVQVIIDSIGFALIAYVDRSKVSLLSE